MLKLIDRTVMNSVDNLKTHSNVENCLMMGLSGLDCYATITTKQRRKECLICGGVNSCNRAQ